MNLNPKLIELRQLIFAARAQDDIQDLHWIWCNMFGKDPDPGLVLVHNKADHEHYLQSGHEVKAFIRAWTERKNGNNE